MKIIIVGCGRLGSGLAFVFANRGDQVAVVDMNPNAFERLDPGFRGKTIAGVGFDGDVLLKAGIKEADALAAVTSSDEANIITARLASQIFHVPKVVARLYEPVHGDTFRNLGIPNFCTVDWGIQRVVDLFSYTPSEVTYSLGTGEVDILEKIVPASFVGHKQVELALPGEISVIAISRAGRTFIPLPETVFEDGDTVHLAVLDSASSGLQELFK